MNDVHDVSTPEPPAQKKGVAWLAWIVILALVAFFSLRTYIVPEREEPAGPEDKRLLGAFEEVQVRYLIGAQRELAGEGVDLFPQAEMFNKGSVARRLRFVVIAGEMRGADQARTELRQLEQLLADHADAASANDRRLLGILERLYSDYGRWEWMAPSVTPDERQFVKNELGWLGEVALAPKPPPWNETLTIAGLGAAPLIPLEESRRDLLERREPILEPAENTFIAMISSVGGVLVVGFLGLLGLAVLWTQARAGKVQHGIETGRAHGAVYAETFACWLALFSVLLVGVALIPLELPALMSSALAMLASLAALGWPVLRGIPFAQVRRDIGWTLGAQPALEPLLGPVFHAFALPFVSVGLVIVMFALRVQGHLAEGTGDPFSDPPSGIQPHPVLKFLIDGDALTILSIFVLAGVVAPIVEETMFRGVLYRHLREASTSRGITASIVFSVLVSSFVFAILHPTGLIAVPLLMALAFGFAIGREWRGTLIPCMVAHGLNNTLVLWAVLSIVRA